MKLLFWTLLALVGCDDTLYGVKPVGGDGTTGSGGGASTGGTGGTGGTTGAGGGDTGPAVDSADPGGTAAADGFCGVLNLFAAECLVCHSAAAVTGGLDLETDPHGALVEQTSATYGVVLVSAGDPAGSLLYTKMAGTQASDQGGVMPLTGALDAGSLSVVYDWIVQGATQDCKSGVDTGIEPSAYHPDGWADPAEHGTAAKYQDDDCLICHGDDLSGGDVGVSCDDCHIEGWRTTCTYCHGGELDSTGAPPRDISGETDTAALSFGSHSAHVTASATHLEWDCTECHVKPDQALSVGHFLVDDATPGISEVDFAAGLSAVTSWSGGAGSCSNNYCHGNGQSDNGTAAAGDSFSACSSCHPDGSSSESAWSQMSGQHKKHMKERLACADCHADTTNGAQVIVGVENHVNGSAEVVFTEAVKWDGSRCTGTCHGQRHSAGENTWLGGD